MKNNSKPIKITIESLISRIIYLYITDCANANTVIKKIYINSHLCEFMMKYHYIMYNTAFRNNFKTLYQSFINRCYLMATNYGCVMSWLTFAHMCPEMISDECHLVLNKNTEIYKIINWDYIKNNKLFEEEYDIFLKYNQTKENVLTETNI
jgi:hypothetical protein